MEQNYEAGFQVIVASRQHDVHLTVDSYESARVVTNPNGVLTIECKDTATLLNSALPTRSSLHPWGAFTAHLFGLDDDPNEGDKQPERNELTLLFTDTLTMEMWLSSEFLPSLDIFQDEDGDPIDRSDEMIRELTKNIMKEIVGQAARIKAQREY